MGKLLAGWCEVSLTPERKISLYGQFAERISEYVETPVTATTLAIESDGEQLVMCSCDLGDVREELIEEIRVKVAATCNLPVKKIIINATHSHTSHVYSEDGSFNSSINILNEYLNEDKKYAAKVEGSGEEFLPVKEAFDYLVENISRSIITAWENRKPAKYATGFGRAAVGMCRRVCYDDGSAKMWGDTNSANFTNLEGGNDSGIEILYFYDENENLTGVVANVACPSQIVEHRSFVSSDYWGKVKILLREKFGESLCVLGLCSAAGDQCPRDMIRWVNPCTPVDDPHIEREDYIERNADPSMFDIEGTWKVGKRIANEIVWAYDEVNEIFEEAVLKHEVIKFDLPLRRVTPAEKDAAINAIKAFSEKADANITFVENAMMYVHAGTLERFELQKKVNLVPIELHIARFGDIAIATNPFELFLDYGNKIRARSRARQTILIQLASGHKGYLPTKRAEEGSHYSAYVSGGFVGHEGGELLVRKSIEEINKLFNS